jgi:hypothetical protein
MEDNITRAEAIKKMGKYAAFTALGTMIILNPKTAQAMSAPGNSGGNPHDGPPGWPGGGKGRRGKQSMFNK